MRYLVEFSGDLTVEALTEEEAKEAVVKALELAGVSITNVTVVAEEER